MYLETWYAASGIYVLPSPRLTFDLFMEISDLLPFLPYMGMAVILVIWP